MSKNSALLGVALLCMLVAMVFLFRKMDQEIQALPKSPSYLPRGVSR